MQGIVNILYKNPCCCAKILILKCGKEFNKDIPHSFTHFLSSSLTPLIIHSFLCSVTHYVSHIFTLICSLTLLHAHFLIHSLPCLHPHPLTCSLSPHSYNHLLTFSPNLLFLMLIYSPPHSVSLLICSFTQPPFTLYITHSLSSHSLTQTFPQFLPHYSLLLYGMSIIN